MKKTLQLLQMTWCEICGDTVDYVHGCDFCDRKVCQECISTEYNDFSWYDGSVNIDTSCDVCSGKIHYKVLDHAV